VTSRERIDAILNFQPADTLPVIEWAPHWDKTIDRWKSEGMPAHLDTSEAINDYFGLDRLIVIWVSTRGHGCPEPAGRGKPIVRSEEDYERIRECLYPDPAVDPAELERIARAQAEGAAVWFALEGFFWHPRTLLGIEGHLYAFLDQPNLMKHINQRNLEFVLRTTEQICEYVHPQFMDFTEDMSYNHGAMISKAMFDEHLAPFCRQASAFIKTKGVKVIIDSDGLVDDPVDWYLETGCDGFLPLEKQAGVDIAKYRNKHPSILLIGAFDKMCMHQGEDAMRREFERLFPVMRQGGYIPGVDHQTPPEVSLDNYRLYLKLLREYCEKAAGEPFPSARPQRFSGSELQSATIQLPEDG